MSIVNLTAKMENSISGIVSGDMPQISSGFTDRELIAEHGVYIIVKAKHLGKWFKLKALKAECASDPMHRELLRKEFELGFPLEHPNIVRTYDFVEDAELGACIVQEYVQGLTSGFPMQEKLPVGELWTRLSMLCHICTLPASFIGISNHPTFL